MQCFLLGYLVVLRYEVVLFFIVFCQDLTPLTADKGIYVEGKIYWDDDRDIVLHTKGNIVFKKGGKIISTKKGSIILKVGMLPGEKDEYESTVVFEGDIPQIETTRNGKIKIYYNPTKGEEEHKYHNPTIYGDDLPREKLETYMLVNDIYDLQGIPAKAPIQ